MAQIIISSDNKTKAHANNMVRDLVTKCSATLGIRKTRQLKHLYILKNLALKLQDKHTPKLSVKLCVR